MQQLHFETKRDVSHVIKFMEELPRRLRVELAVKIHKEIIQEIPFFQDQPKDFIEFIGTTLKPLKFKEDHFVFKEKESVDFIYFLNKGIAALCLPKCDNLVYVTIEKGICFGIIDLIEEDRHDEERQGISKNVKRKFSCMCLTNCEVLALGIEDVIKMENQFPDKFDDLFCNVYARLKLALKKKKEAKTAFSDFKTLSTTRRSRTGL